MKKKFYFVKNKLNTEYKSAGIHKSLEWSKGQIHYLVVWGKGASTK